MKQDDKKNSPQAPQAGRRRLIKGAAAAPVLMTLASRPAWGVGGGNFCWSGIQSGNLSGHDHNTCEFGRSPGYYKDNVEAHGDGPGWPAGYEYGCEPKPNGTLHQPDKVFFKTSAAGEDTEGTLFTDVFSGGFGTPYEGMTLMQVLWQMSGSFGFHAIAALFNSINFPGYAFQTADVLTIANDILTTGSHTTPQGQTWYGDQMKCLFDASYHPTDDHDPSCI